MTATLIDLSSDDKMMGLRRYFETHLTVYPETVDPTNDVLTVLELKLKRYSVLPVITETASTFVTDSIEKLLFAREVMTDGEFSDYEKTALGLVTEITEDNQDFLDSLKVLDAEICDRLVGLSYDLLYVNDKKSKDGVEKIKEDKSVRLAKEILQVPPDTALISFAIMGTSRSLSIYKQIADRRAKLFLTVANARTAAMEFDATPIFKYIKDLNRLENRMIFPKDGDEIVAFNAELSKIIGESNLVISTIMHDKRLDISNAQNAADKATDLITDTSETVDFIIDIIDSKGDKGSRKYILESKWCKVIRQIFSVFGLVETFFKNNKKEK